MRSRTAPAFSDNNPVTVVIDAGDGGEDGGASSKSGVLESTINLEIAGITNDLLRFAGVRTAMVRTQDVSVYTEGGSIQQKKVSDLKNRVKLVESLSLIHISNPYRDKQFRTVQQAKKILESCGVETVMCLPFDVDRDYELPKTMDFRDLHREIKNADMLVCFGGCLLYTSRCV